MTYRGALALNTHTMSALREGIYFIGEGGGEGKTVEKLQWKTPAQENREKISSKEAQQHTKDWICGMEWDILYNLRLQKYCCSEKLPTPL